MTIKIAAHDLQSRLTQGNFERDRPLTDQLGDPLIETAMVVTLDQLRPFDLNPRLTRNPGYDEIKASIRQRGLDTSPPITRRPSEKYFIIANGGNTRLAILNELWSETHDERFSRIHCLFKPWKGTESQPSIGDLHCLVGHLAENDLHGRLSFIERALGIAKARQLYEQTQGVSLSQRSLAELLKKDGYPIAQSQISRMDQTLQYLLPCIPDVLYSGLGRPKAERLLALRASAHLSWTRFKGQDQLSLDVFEEIFINVLSQFNAEPDAFAIEHVQDELLGAMSNTLGVDYNLLLLDVDAGEQKRRSLLGPTPEPEPYNPPEPVVTQDPGHAAKNKTSAALKPTSVTINSNSDRKTNKETISAGAVSISESDSENQLISPPLPDLGITESTQHLTQQSVSIPPSPLPQSSGDTRQELTHFSDLPVLKNASGNEGNEPVKDIWFIEPLFDHLESLLGMTDRLAWDMAEAYGIEDLVRPVDAPSFIGYELAPLVSTHPEYANTKSQACWSLLAGIANIPIPAGMEKPNTLDSLLGFERTVFVWPDTFVIKLLRLIRVTRRIKELCREATI
jgi:ParB family protein of integrating conjugative element (PFGI_1 class)